MERTFTADLLWISLALLLIGINGFFVAAEFALVKARPTRLAQMAKLKKPFAGSALWLSRRLDRSLSACQLGITMASLALGWIGEPAVAHLVKPVFHAVGINSVSLIHGLSFTIAFTLITVGHLVLGEQVPKIFAIRQPERLALWCAAPMRAFYVTSYPLLRALDTAASSILRVIGVGQVSEHEHHTEEEIRALLGHARTHGQLSSWEHKLVEAAFEFDDMLCRQIMVPRADVVFFDVGTPLAKLLDIARRTLHTRYPVCDGSLDEALGIVHMKDLVGIPPEAEFDLRSVMRSPKYVPETIRISRLLGHFQATHQHLAFVVDEFGAVIGVVTLENVLEQIIGPVQDEFDVETPDIVPDGPQRWLVSGSTPIDKLNEMLEEEIEVEGVDTVAGLIAVELGRIPVQGDRVELGDAVLVVIEAEKNRVNRVRLEYLRRTLEGSSDRTAPESD